MTVDFLICGTQKGGTSALDAYCRQHPELLLPAEKELHFFDDETRFSGLEADYSHYHQHFPKAVAGKLRGESTPVYMYWPNAAARIQRYNPDMKLIVLLRNPVERAYSHWQMESTRGHESLSFSEAIRTEDSRLSGGSSEDKRVYSYIDRGRYQSQLENLWALFGREQVLVLFSEDLRRVRDEVLTSVSEFLGIAPFPGLSEQTVNSQTYARPMNPNDRDYLQALLASDIAALESMLGVDLGHWQ